MYEKYLMQFFYRKWKKSATEEIKSVYGKKYCGRVIVGSGSQYLKTATLI